MTDFEFTRHGGKAIVFAVLFAICVWLLWDAFKLWQSPEFKAEIERMKRDGEENRRRQKEQERVDRQKRAGWWKP